MTDRFEEGDLIRVKETGEIGHVSQVSSNGTYWVVLTSRLNEAKYRGEELARK